MGEQRQRSDEMMRGKWVLVVLAALILVGTGGCVDSVKTRGMAQEPLEYPIEVRMESESADALQALEVVQWTFVPHRGLPGENTYKVSGELRNGSGQHFRVVFLDVSLYDANGGIVATSTVRASNIGPGETGIISGYVMDKTCTPHPTGRIRVGSGG